MARPKLPLLPRLLSKIDVPGIPDVSPYIGVPIADWPDELTKPDWRWVGAVASRYMIRTWVKGVAYAYNRPEMPAFKVDGKRVVVHNLLYKLFVGIQPSLRYRSSPPNYLDVNPAHWVTQEQRERPPQREEAHMFDQMIHELVEIMHGRVAVGRHPTEGLLEHGFTQEQIDAAIIIVNPPNLNPGGLYVPKQEVSP